MKKKGPPPPPPIPRRPMKSWKDSGLKEHLLLPIGPLHATEDEAFAVNETADRAPTFSVCERTVKTIKILYGPAHAYADIRVDAIVNLTNESLSDWSGLSGVLLKYGGPQLKEECDFVPTGCQVGESKVTRGCNLNASYVIHTVGPTWKEKNATAAESALHCCYKSALSLAKEQGAKSIAFPCLYSKKKGYPREEGSQIAVRTVRRFLDHYGNDFDHVVFFVSDESDFEMYYRSLTLFCPRDEDEAGWSERHLKAEMKGNEWGECIIEERQIRISAGFSEGASRPPHDPSFVDKSAFGGDPVVYGADSMADSQMYKLELERAKELDLKDIFALNIVYESGVDYAGRPVIALVARNMNVPDVDLDRLFLYIIKTFDETVSGDRGYSLVILDDDVNLGSFPSIGWVKTLYEDVLPKKYKKNIKAMYVVHPTWKLKALFWAAMPFVSSKFWDKHHYLDTLDELYNFVPQDQLLLPKAVYETDAKNKESWF